MTKLIKRASAEARAFRTQREPRGMEIDQADQADGTAGLRHAGGARPKPQRAAKRRHDGEPDGAWADADHAGAARTERPGPPRFAPVTFSEEGGVRYLHFGTPWVQGAMRLKHPWRLELEYAQQMMAWLLFIDPPARVVQLGLGTAALTKFCYKRMPAARIEAVELNPMVVVAAHTMFNLPCDDERLCVHEMDAWDFVTAAANRGTIGALQIDLYDATARGPVLDSVAFYRACRACLSEPGVASINLFGDHPSFEKNLRHLRTAFGGRVVALPEVHEGNRVALVFAGAPLDFSWKALQSRAQYLEKTFKLPARDWVKRLAESHPGSSFRI